MSLKDSFENPSGKNAPLTFYFPEVKERSEVKAYVDANEHSLSNFYQNGLSDGGLGHGRFICVRVGRDICAASSACNITSPKDNLLDGYRLTEIGQTIQSLPSYALYPSLIAAHLVHEFIKRPPKDRFVIAVNRDDILKAHILESQMGWQKWTDVPDSYDSLFALEDKPLAVLFSVTTDRIPHQARLVLDLVNKNEIKETNGSRSKVLDFSSFSLANEYRKAVEELAKGFVGRYLEQSGHMGMALAQDGLKRNMNLKYGVPDIRTY